ncbi:zinc finger MYM-type protein 1-like [Rhopalosiphum padi]|nr:zinc finger MYM-type protein 1-like [Rhopalosiphum padi]
MSGDINLAEHLKTAQGNASYISADIQNQILTSCSNLILKQIISKVNAAKCFTVLADETADISGIEQFSLCVRYFEFSSMQMREDFLTFVPVTDVTGMGLANTLLNTLDKLGIDLKYLRGQGFDGAATMSGCFNGVQSHVTKKYPLAHYIHCTSHCLNLAISDTCNVQSIRNCTGTIQKVCVFFKYPKRQNVMLESIKRVCPESQITKLKLLFPTRWVDRHDSIITFMELFDAVIDGLPIISTWPDRESSSGAYQLLCAIKQPEFILATHLLAKVFSISLLLSKLLQIKNIDLIEAMSLADNVSDVLKNIKNNADEDFKKLFLKVKEKYNFISQLHDRFIAHKSLITNFCCLLPNNNLPNREENIKSLTEKYNEDLQ